MIGSSIAKSWTVPSPIRYVKVTSLYFEEVLLLGLMNGQVSDVYFIVKQILYLYLIFTLSYTYSCMHIKISCTNLNYERF